VSSSIVRQRRDVGSVNRGSDRRNEREEQKRRVPPSKAGEFLSVVSSPRLAGSTLVRPFPGPPVAPEAARTVYISRSASFLDLCIPSARGVHPLEGPPGDGGPGEREGKSGEALGKSAFLRRPERRRGRQFFRCCAPAAASIPGWFPRDQVRLCTSCRRPEIAAAVRMFLLPPSSSERKFARGRASLVTRINRASAVARVSSCVSSRRALTR